MVADKIEIKTLKELKKLFPERITTSGNNYYIEGLGWYKQKRDYFGLWTLVKDFDGHWVRTNFEELVKYMNQLYK